MYTFTLFYITTCALGAGARHLHTITSCYVVVRTCSLASLPPKTCARKNSPLYPHPERSSCGAHSIIKAYFCTIRAAAYRRCARARGHCRRIAIICVTKQQSRRRCRRRSARRFSFQSSAAAQFYVAMRDYVRFVVRKFFAREYSV